MILNVAVIFGGKSVEHEISIISALQTIKAIDKTKYDVLPIYISKKGEWYTGKKLFAMENFKNIDALLIDAKKVYLNFDADECNLYYAKNSLLRKKLCAKLDIVFPVLHGTHGEDGSLQGFMELLNIPYVGCDVLSSAITMDKLLTKQILKACDIPHLDYVTFTLAEWINAKEELCAAIKNKFPYPLIVKPNNLGSSIGVTSVTSDDELDDAIDLALSMSSRVLIEPKVQNLKEVNCAVLGDADSVEVSVCEEPVKNDDILSYQDKYMNNGKHKNATENNAGMANAKRKIPADITLEIQQKIQELAKKAFLNLHCFGVVRIDFLIDQSTNNIYLCELNTIPGSLSFYLWEPSNISFTSLTNKLIEIAIKRYRAKNNLILSYGTNVLENFNGAKSTIKG